MAVGGAASWVIATAAVGWTGVPGVLTAAVCKMESSGRGGSHLYCTGTFVSRDGRMVDRDAEMRWDGGKSGDVRNVQTLVIGGYAQRDAGQGVGDVGLGAGLLAVSVVCGFFTLSRRCRERIVHRLPDRAQIWYAKEFDRLPGNRA
jgi:hypothetical protein